MKQLNETTWLFQKDDRDWDDVYRMNAGQTYCFQFDILPTVINTITLVHDFLPAQDLSLRVWFSTKPVGESIYAVDSLQYFSMFRYPKAYNFGTTDSTAIYNLAAGQYWIMIQNLQNAPNAFKVLFTD